MKSAWKLLVVCVLLPGAALAAQVSPVLSISDVVVNEGTDRTVSAVFKVTLIGSTTQTVTVDWVTTNLTATGGADYKTSSGRVKFLPGGSRQATVKVPVYRDRTPEPAEVFFVQLWNAVNATISKGTGHAAIVDGSYASGASKCDLDGRGRSDILVGVMRGQPIDNHTDKHEPWEMTGTIGQPLATVHSEWDIIATNEFNGDGICDLVWRDEYDRIAVVVTPPDRTLRGPTEDDVVATVPGSWTAVGSADFSGDARADVLWWNSEGASLEVWVSAWESGRVEFPNGLRRIFPVNASPAWRPAALADLNADGSPDLLWQNTTTYQVKYWRRPWQESYELTQEGVVNPAPQGALDLIASGDFDGNRTDDLLFQEVATLKLDVWFMQGSSRVAESFTSPSKLGPRLLDGSECPIHSSSWEVRGPR